MDDKPHNQSNHTKRKRAKVTTTMTTANTHTHTHTDRLTDVEGKRTGRYSDKQADRQEQTDSGQADR